MILKDFYKDSYYYRIKFLIYVWGSWYILYEKKFYYRKLWLLVRVGKNIFLLWVRFWLYTLVIRSIFCLLFVICIFIKDVLCIVYWGVLKVKVKEMLGGNSVYVDEKSFL